MNNEQINKHKHEFMAQQESLPEFINQVCNILTNKNRIEKSLVFPFRYLSAYNELNELNGKHVRQVLSSLSEAIDISCRNVPVFDGETLVVADFSGSMGEGVDSFKGKASVLGTVLAKSSNADFMIFGDDAKYVNINTTDSTLSTVQNLLTLNTGNSEIQVGYGTNLNSVFQKADKAYNRIVILSDMQAWIGWSAPTLSFACYRYKYNANPYIYSIDLAGYGTLQFPEKKVFCLAGFSDKIFDTMKVMEKDQRTLVNEIEKIEL